jgi:DNA polymerase V
VKYIGLLDCNNFFVSCERVFRPDLKNVPTVVLSSNDGCVVARSKEIKEMGVPMGVPYFKVKDELKKANAAVFSSNFPLYRDISSRVMEILKEEAGFVEQYSVDEAFFALDMQEANVSGELLRIKRAIETRVGIPVSVGAAKTKTIAKYASEVGKKTTGTSVMCDSLWQEATKTLLVSEIWGIGRQTSQKMKDLGIVTVSDLLAVDIARVDRLFGIGGLRLHDELSERSVHTLGGERSDQKSIMSTRSFKNTTTDRSVIEDALAYHVSHAAAELRAMKMKTTKMSVIAGTSRHGDWLLRGGSRDVILSSPTSDTRVLLKEALKLLGSLYEEGVPYKKAGIVLGSFVSEDLEQGDLFISKDDDSKSSYVMHTIDVLNKRFGNETITIGRKTSGTVWKSSREFVSPCYTTNWDEIATIKT